MSDTPTAGEKRKIKVVVADDDPFTLSMVSDGLRSLGYEVHTAASAELAGALVSEEDPHALITDLNFGKRETGASLLRRVHESQPWVALVILTSHHSPQLAVEDPEHIPGGVVYLVKSQLKRVDDIGDAVQRALAGTSTGLQVDASGTILVSPAQAEVLRMLASGASTKAIADRRATTVRAAEAMINRLYLALGLDDDSQTAPRVAAIELWQQGRIAVK